MAGAGGLLLVGLAFSGVLGLLLYVAVRAEGRDRRVLSREEAERAARRDTEDEP